MYYCYSYQAAREEENEKDKRQMVKPNNNEMPNCQLEALRRDPTTRTKENQEKARVTSIKCVTDKCKVVLYQKEEKQNTSTHYLWKPKKTKKRIRNNLKSNI